jgi:hypothetical protein
MQTVHIPSFFLGIKEELDKIARCWEGYRPVPGKEPYSEDSCVPVKKKKEKKADYTDLSKAIINENILPNIDKQTKWKYVKTKDGLKLSDGNLVYSFGLPAEYPAEDTKVNRLTDDNILNFENDALEKGTAQIHRSSPNNLYLTLANGRLNPTFILSHEQGKDWRYSPSKKFIEKLKNIEKTIPENLNKSVDVDPASLIQAAKDQSKEPLLAE